MPNLNFLKIANTKRKPTENSGSEQGFPALTGVRAIAAYMVFFHHYIGSCQNTIILNFVKEFYTGVTIFFVLSGFLIYYRYSDSAILNKTFLSNYFKNRFARIYPVYFFIVTITSLFSLYNPADGGALNQLFLSVMQLTFVRGFFDSFKFIGVGQGWTLTVEESFYFLFPILITIIRKRGFVIALLGVYFVGIVLMIVGAIINFQGFFSPVKFAVFYTFFGRAAEFFCGMFLARIVLAKGIKNLPKKIPFFTVVSLAALPIAIFFMSTFQETCTYGSDYAGGMIINDLVLPIFISSLFYGLIIEETVVRNFLGSRPMVLLGKSSYVFYLIHVGLIQFILQAFVSSNMFIIFIIMNLLAILIYLNIEEPMRKLIRQLQFHQQ